MVKEDKHAKKGDGENIKVAIRVRPLFQKEIDRGEKECVECDIAANEVIVRGEAGAPYRWTFDYVFNRTFQQNDIFLQVVHPMIESTMEGFNSTIFAYGQSGSGKTHTMAGVLGDKVLEGIIPRSFHYIFDRIKEAGSGVSWRVFCSFVELYNGKCRDLLCENQVSLAIREAADKSFFVQDLQMIECKFEKELFRHMEEGTDRRLVGETDLNAHSSRSHSLFTVLLERTEQSEEGDCKVVSSKLNLVDLAGSERQSKTNASGDRLKEGANINLSLSALGTVIDSIVKAKGHIPFRSSPLTMLLKDSLGGGSKTAMFANIRPSDADISETVSTLRFADRAKQIKNKPKIQMDPKDAKIAELMEEIEDLKARLRKYEGNGPEPEEEEESPQMQERMEQLEVELEQATNLNQRLQMEVEQARGLAQKAQGGLDGQISELQEKCLQLTQEKDLVAQQALDEKGQHHELQTVVLDFLRDIRSRDEVLGKEEPLDGQPYSVDRVSQMLEKILARVQQGVGGVAPAVAEQQVQSLLQEQRKKFEEQDKERNNHHQEEVERISALNEQAQTALNQAMNRLVKMKEKIEKEKAKTQEVTDTYKKQIEESEAKHATEVSNMRSVIADLEDQLQKQKAMTVELSMAAGNKASDALRKSWERSGRFEGSSLSMSASLGRGTSPTKRAAEGKVAGRKVTRSNSDVPRRSGNPTVQQAEQEVELLKKANAMKQNYEAQKSSLQQQLKRLEEETAAMVTQAESGGGAPPDQAVLREKEVELQKLQAEMADLKKGFAKDKQAMAARINNLKATKPEPSAENIEEVRRMEEELKKTKVELDKKRALFDSSSHEMTAKLKALEAEKQALALKAAEPHSPSSAAEGHKAQAELEAKEKEFQRMKEEMEKLKQQFVSDKQEIASKIGNLQTNIDQQISEKKSARRNKAHRGEAEEEEEDEEEEAPRAKKDNKKAKAARQAVEEEEEEEEGEEEAEDGEAVAPGAKKERKAKKVVKKVVRKVVAEEEDEEDAEEEEEEEGELEVEGATAKSKKEKRARQGSRKVVRKVVEEEEEE
eukprot:EG_transcript_1648